MVVPFVLSQELHAEVAKHQVGRGNVELLGRRYSSTVVDMLASVWFADAMTLLDSLQWLGVHTHHPTSFLQKRHAPLCNSSPGR